MPDNNSDQENKTTAYWIDLAEKRGITIRGDARHGPITIKRSSGEWLQTSPKQKWNGDHHIIASTVFSLDDEELETYLNECLNNDDIEIIVGLHGLANY